MALCQFWSVMVRTRVVGRLESGMRVSASFQIIPRPVGQLGLGPGPHVVGRLGYGMRVSASFQLR